MISLCMLTYRPGGIDIFARSFDSMKPDDDYEVILVDDCPGRVERGTVPTYFKQLGIKLGWYGKSKAKSMLDTKRGYVNAMNTALCHARGDWTLWISDYTFLPPNWLQQWEYFLKIYENQHFLVSGSAIVYNAPKPVSPGDIETWGPDLTTFSPKWPWVPWEFETFYVLVPMKFFLDINGMDERADHTHTWAVSSQKTQAKSLGYVIGTKAEHTCFMIDHRDWEEKDEQWKIGEEQSLEVEPTWVVPSPNKFDLAALRKENGIV